MDEHERTARRAAKGLDGAPMGEMQRVVRVEAPAEAPEWGRWLEEIGFIPGERVRIMARAVPGGGPLVVRVGQSTFALRRAEAACIEVAPTVVAASSGVISSTVTEAA